YKSITLCFFFSSRRRHTRFSRDWSSDVCSSDLGGFRDSPGIREHDIPAYHNRPSAPTNLIRHQAIEINGPIGCGDVPVFPGDIRSEERRVGAEDRTSTSEKHERIKTNKEIHTDG